MTKRFWGALVVLLMAVQGVAAAHEAGGKKSGTPACKQVHIEYRKTEEMLHSAANALKVCTTGNSIHNDCASDFAAVGTAEHQLQWVLREKLHPLCDDE